MSQKAKKAVHLCYGVILTLLIALVGVALILSCIEIYKSGNRPFSRESIAAAFDRIDMLVYAAMIAIGGGIVLSVVLPLERIRPKAAPDEYAVLRRLRKKVGSAVPSVEQKHRQAFRIGLVIVSVACFAWPVLTLCDVSGYGLEDLNRDVLRGALPVLIGTAIVMLLAALVSFLNHRSVQREIAACKQAIAEGRTAPIEGATNENRLEAVHLSLKKHERKSVLVIRCVVLAVAILFIVLGILNGGIDDVLGKAIRICTECIGLG